MKNLLTKIKYTIQADLHDLFDKKVEKNPIKMLNQYIREAEKQTEETGKLLQRQGQLKKELELQLIETVEMLEKREAQLSLAQGTEDTELIAFAQDEVAAYTARKQALLTSIDAALIALLLRLDVAGRNVDAFDDDLVRRGHSLEDLTLLALVLAGQDDDLVVLLNVHNQLPP